ncbi:hypothetical protein GCM10009687_80730 [Asanoa iriomotensis]
MPQRVEPARRSAELTDAEAVARQVNALQPGTDTFRATRTDELLTAGGPNPSVQTGDRRPPSLPDMDIRDQEQRS